MKLLLLAGTSDARRLAAQVCDLSGVEVIASLAGATRKPRALDVPTITGGFGGEAGQREYLKNNEIDAVVDATHPFAAQISVRSHRLCRAMGLAYVQLLRPAWAPQEGDQWVTVDRGEDAEAHIAKGARVFLATGRQTLPMFEGLLDRHLIFRQIDPPGQAFPYANGEFLVGRPPFSIADEIGLFKQLKIDWLVVKNAGGAASKSKLDAARALGIPVLMLNRPPQPEGPSVASVKEAFDWVRGQVVKIHG